MHAATLLQWARLRIDVRDADLLLAYALHREREWLLAHPETTIHPSHATRFRRMVIRRTRGEPLAHLLGTQWFFGRTFRVTHDVLIPRPETELSVELALGTVPISEPTTIIDVGTGSGCIAVTMAAERPRARVIALDASPSALHIARHNARTHQVRDRIAFHQSNLLDFQIKNGKMKNAPFVILANLPYLTTAEWRALPNSLRTFEPRNAFDGGRDGLYCFRTFFRQLSSFATHHRVRSVFLEIDPQRKPALTRLTQQRVPHWHRGWHRDLADRWRVLELRPPEMKHQ
ncbi:peptide chain release factor N(5)-glutamine methyltransferase [Candidatus Uhrbacteria bacterium]|nr:peptide chain release factor N(5)-glutamine methyltransferase [Candidatus Uhrbacteria bacterium]